MYLYATCLCWDEVCGFWTQVLDLHIVIKDGFCMVGHYWEQVVLKHHLPVVEVEATDLEQTRLDVERERVETHGADERDPCRQNVEQIAILADPQALQLGQNVQRLKHLQIQHLDIRQPDLGHKLQIYGKPLLFDRCGRQVTKVPVEDIVWRARLNICARLEDLVTEDESIILPLCEEVARNLHCVL